MEDASKSHIVFHEEKFLQHFISRFVIFKKQFLLEKSQKPVVLDKWRPDSEQKTTLKMTYHIPRAHRSLLMTSVIRSLLVDFVRLSRELLLYGGW